MFTKIWELSIPLPQSLNNTLNMHVLMMFQRKAEKVFQYIHDGLGHAKEN